MPRPLAFKKARIIFISVPSKGWKSSLLTWTSFETHGNRAPARTGVSNRSGMGRINRKVAEVYYAPDTPTCCGRAV